MDNEHLSKYLKTKEEYNKWIRSQKNRNGNDFKIHTIQQYNENLENLLITLPNIPVNNVFLETDISKLKKVHQYLLTTSDEIGVINKRRHQVISASVFSFINFLEYRNK